MLKTVMDRHFDKVKFDSKLAKALYRFNIEYINSSREYLEFYGSNLLGVQIVRFKDSDVSRFFDILDVDHYRLREDIKTVTDINQAFKISSDTLNLTIMYLLHRFINSTQVDAKTRDRVLFDVGSLFFYRTLAALISDNFRYPADPKIVQKAYANLSNKYLIKRLGTWGKVVEYRANKLVNAKGLHYNAIKNLDDDLAIVYAINDSQGRVRDIVKNYYGEFIKVHSQGESIGRTSSTVLDAEGEETVKDKTMSVERYIHYVEDLLSDEHGLIKDDLLTIISKINSNVSYRSLRQVLKWMVNAYGHTQQHKLVDEFVQVSLVHSFHLIEYTICPSSLRDYSTILAQLKNLLASSRSTDPDLLRIKQLGEEIVTMAFPYKVNTGLVIATRSSVVMYLVLRALVGNQP